MRFSPHRSATVSFLSDLFEGVVIVAEFEEKSAADALEESIAVATHLKPEHHAAIEAARALARRVDDLDANDWIVGGKLDNVSMPTYLRSLQLLGLMPSTPATGAKGKPRNDLEEWKQRARSGGAD